MLGEMAVRIDDLRIPMPDPLPNLVLTGTVEKALTDETYRKRMQPRGFSGVAVIEPN
jgi:hypothetical protein